MRWIWGVVLGSWRRSQIHAACRLPVCDDAASEGASQHHLLRSCIGTHLRSAGVYTLCSPCALLPSSVRPVVLVLAYSADKALLHGLQLHPPNRLRHHDSASCASRLPAVHLRAHPLSQSRDGHACRISAITAPSADVDTACHKVFCTASAERICTFPGLVMPTSVPPYHDCSSSYSSSGWNTVCHLLQVLRVTHTERPGLGLRTLRPPAPASISQYENCGQSFRRGTRAIQFSCCPFWRRRGMLRCTAAVGRPRVSRA